MQMSRLQLNIDYERYVSIAANATEEDRAR